MKRNFAEIAKGENSKLSEDEIEPGATLIENMSDEFNPEKYRDEYRERVQSMLMRRAKARRSQLQRRKHHSVNRSLT